MPTVKEQIDRLNADITRRAEEASKAYAASTAGQVQAKVTRFSRLTYQFTSAASWVFQKIVTPTYRFLSVPVRWLWGLYVREFVRWSTIEDLRAPASQGRRVMFSRPRAGLFVLITGLFAYFLLIPIVMFIFDVGLYTFTVKRNEVVYLTNSQEIFPGSNVHSTQGCHSLPCTDGNSIYFRIRVNLFNEAWSILHGHGLFFPDYVAAAIPVTISRCTITSYGIRVKLFMRGTDIYPDLLKSECQPIGVVNP